MIEVVLGTIVGQETDEIVNAPNEMLLPSSGISGAIHAVAGQQLALECNQIGRCPTGQAA